MHVAVSRSRVRLYVDCQQVAEKPPGEARSPPAHGFVILGRLASAQGSENNSAPVSLGF